MDDSRRERDARLSHWTSSAGTEASRLGEGARRRGRDRIHLFSISSGSAEEVRTALRVAVAWGYLRESAVTEVLQEIDRLQRILWTLMR